MTTNHEVAGSTPAADTLPWWERPTVHAKVLTTAGMFTLRTVDALLLARLLRRLEQRERWTFWNAARLLTAVIILAWNARIAGDRARHMLGEFERIRREAEDDERRLVQTRG